MRELSFSTFITNIKSFVDKSIKEKQHLKIRRRSGRDFIIVSLEDWENERETVFVLQNYPLMTQIAESEETHASDSGYIPQKEEINEIISI